MLFLTLRSGFELRAEGLDPGALVTVYPEEYPYALRNPMKGFRSNVWEKPMPYTTLARHYIRWNEIENDEADSIEKIREFCNAAWAGLEEKGIKVIPRVYLDWNGEAGNEYWPADMQTGDFTSEQFKRRVARLVARLGECWDEDPRVAWVQMGIVGFWGEHHSPEPTEEVEALLGKAFTAAFRNKRVLVRRPVDFTDFEFGIYWDSWAHVQQIDDPDHGAGLLALNRSTGRWKTHPIEGETAYDWGLSKVQPGDGPNDTLSDPQHREFLLDSIRALHCSGLGWVARHDADNPAVAAGAEQVQRAFGYRLVVTEFACSQQADPGGELRLRFSVRNDGSAPVYERWPVAFCLLDPETRRPVWQAVLSEVDIRAWLGGDDWDAEGDFYREPAQTFDVEASLSLPGKASLPAGTYLAALGILDPVGGEPQARFAVRNYFAGGWHPFARVAVGEALRESPELAAALFDDPGADGPLAYALLAEAAGE